MAVVYLGAAAGGMPRAAATAAAVTIISSTLELAQGACFMSLRTPWLARRLVA